MHTAASPAICSVPFAALQAEIKREQSPLRAAITAAYRRDEAAALGGCWRRARGPMATPRSWRTSWSRRYAPSAPAPPAWTH
jgi:RHH-type proline utilization regulon transcriptional repressor/proline dehydrogenase/delta 1-pyrroline-5-carboxylate dehydrogenase